MLDWGKLSVLVVVVVIVGECSAGLVDECSLLTTNAKWMKMYPYVSMLCQMALNEDDTALPHAQSKRSPITAVKKPKEDDGYYFVRFGKRAASKKRNNKKDQSNYDYIRFS